MICFFINLLCITTYFGFTILIFCFNAQLDPGIKESFDVAFENIYAFHVAQKSPENIIENMKVSNFPHLVLL